MATDLGKISETAEGIYDSSKIYERLDLVSFEGGSYLSRINNNDQPLSNVNAWQISASKGDRGFPGEKGDVALKAIFINPEDAAPLIDGVFKPTTSSLDNQNIDPENYGTLYPNYNNFRAKQGYDTLFSLNNNIWKKYETKLPESNPVSEKFDANSDVDPQGGKQINDYFIEPNIINKGSLGQTDVYTINNKSIVCSSSKADKDGYVDEASAYFSGTGFVSIGLMREIAGKCVIDKVIGRFLINSTGVFTFSIKTLIKKNQFLGVTTGDDSLFIGYRQETGSNFKCYWSDGLLQVTQNNFAVAFQFEIDENPIDFKIKESVKTLNYVTSQQDGIITVGKVTGDFNDINSAAQFSIQNGGGHFIDVRPGTYPEHINMFTTSNPFKITLKASAKDTVNVVSHKGDYETPALHTKINSHFIDLNFISMDDQKPSPEPINKSYAVHSDYFLFPDIKVEFEGCKFIQRVNGQHTFGAGSDQNQLLRFTECYFENETNSDVPVILWHAEDLVADTFNQRLEMINCFVNSKGGKTLELFDPRNFGEGSASVLFIGNTFKSETQPNANQTLVLTSNITTSGSLIGKIKLAPESRGNNISKLNYES